MYVCPWFRAFCMEMRKLTGDESALWFVWQKQESNNWSSTAPELACLFCFIEHVKTQGSQNIIIYHPSKNIPSRQRNQNTTYYKDSKLSLNGWRICKSRNVHIKFQPCCEIGQQLYIHKQNQHFTDSNQKRLSPLYNHYLKND